MKKLILLMILLCTLNLSSETILRDWKSYTNTTHISDLLEYDGNYLIATWGGLLTYNPETGEFSDALLRSDGLEHNELSSLAMLEDGTLLIATKGGGISRMQDGEFIMPLNADSGFNLNYVYELAAYGTSFAAITDNGLSVFSQLENWPLPSVTNYTDNNGLSSNVINSIVIDDNILICGTEQGIDYAYLDNPNDLQWNHINTGNSPLSNDNINDIYCKDDKIAIATHSGINTTESLEDFTSWHIYGSGDSYYPVFLDSDDNIWTAKGYWDEDNLTIQDNGDEFILKFTGTGTQTSWNYQDLGLLKGMTTDISFVNGRIIASTWGDGFLFYDGNWSSSIKQNCINANFVVSLYIDSHSNLWTASGLKDHPDLRRGNRGVSCYDGNLWKSYVAENSGLRSNNINSILEADNDLMWFTSYANYDSTIGGLNILDMRNSIEEWDFLADEDMGILSYQIAGMEKANDGNVWFCCYSGGITALNIERQYQYDFYPPRMLYDDFPNTWMVNQGEKYTVCGGKLSGFEVWTGSDRPYTDEISNWLRPEDEDDAITSGFVSDSVERYELFEDQVWIASSEALFMYDGETWFRYGKESTKRQYLTSYGDWMPKELDIGVNDSPDWWYFEGQEHLYGGATTYPTALFVDPFNVLWIGTANNGICRYDIENNLFMTWNTGNSPLFSNYINDLAYEPENGVLYIATNAGLNSVRIGIEEEYNHQEKFNEVVAYPNPFYPSKQEVIRIENIDTQSMPEDAGTCSIYDLEGLLVRELPLNNFQQYEWDGENASGKLCSSGIYFYLITGADGDVKSGKVILVR